MRRVALTDLDTGEIITTRQLRRTNRSRRTTKRARAKRGLIVHHEGFIALVATLGLWIALINN